MLRDILRRLTGPAGHAHGGAVRPAEAALAAPAPPVVAPVPAPPPLPARPIRLTPTRAAHTHLATAARRSMECRWCRVPAKNHGRRYSAIRGPHHAEPHGYQPLRRPYPPGDPL